MYLRKEGVYSIGSYYSLNLGGGGTKLRQKTIDYFNNKIKLNTLINFNLYKNIYSTRYKILPSFNTGSMSILSVDQALKRDSVGVVH